MKYLHGGDIYRNPVQYDFSVNINPLGMPEGCQEAAKKGVDLAGQYPDWKGERLGHRAGRGRRSEERTACSGKRCGRAFICPVFFPASEESADSGTFFSGI